MFGKLALTDLRLGALYVSVDQGPAKTFGLPAATLVQPAIASPILPVPTLLVITVGEPTAIGAEWLGHGTPGNR